MSMANRTSFQLDWKSEESECTVWAHHLANGGRITVCERMTGFGWPDVETGYRSPCGQFWLASGGHDIICRLHTLNSEDEMAQWVIDRANTCTGGHHEWQKVGFSLEYLLARENWRPATTQKDSR